jgi:hypothetical protein
LHNGKAELLQPAKKQEGPAQSKTVFREFSNVTTIVVRRNSKEVKTVYDMKQIGRIVEFLNRYLKEWDSPWAGVPVPECDVQVFSQDEYLGSFGARLDPAGKRDFFATQRQGGFFSKDASHDDVLRFYQLIGILR